VRREITDARAALASLKLALDDSFVHSRFPYNGPSLLKFLFEFLELIDLALCDERVSGFAIDRSIDRVKALLEIACEFEIRPASFARENKELG
jgi:hypothetical protein